MESETILRTLYRRALLQWGHDFSVMESSKLEIFAHMKAFCFNGAMTFQSWKGERRTSRTQGADPLQWGHDFSVMERGRTERGPNLRRENCFNGAMTFQSWKAPERFERITGAKALQWGHDFSVMERPVACGIQLDECGFNGAMTFQSWKGRALPAPHAVLSNLLQWGHDFSVMESC